MENLRNQCVNCCKPLIPKQRRLFSDCKISRCLSEVNGCNFEDFCIWLDSTTTFTCKNCYYKVERLVNARAKIEKLEKELKNEAHLEQNLFKKYITEKEHWPDRREIQMPASAPLRKRQRLQPDFGNEKIKVSSSKEIEAKKPTKQVSLADFSYYPVLRACSKNPSTFISSCKMTRLLRTTKR